MDFFKLLYEHDQRLDSLRTRHTDRSEPETSSTIEDFLKPDPTYSRFYLSGSRPNEQQFGLTTLQRAPELIEIISGIFKDWTPFASNESLASDPLDRALARSRPGDLWIFTKESRPAVSPKQLLEDQNRTMSHKSESLKQALESGNRVLFVEGAHHGLDLHLFSMENIYRELFFPIQEMVNDSFRFFSMNGKRIRSERNFFFETWRLERPPHGVEEVFSESVL